MNKTDGRKVVREVTKALEAAGITHWLQGGVLLGFTREGTFIDGEKDIDFGLAADVDVAEVADLLTREGYEFIVRCGDEERGVWMAFSKYGVVVEFFKMLDRGGTFDFAVWSWGKERTVLTVTAFEAVKVKMGNLSYYAPDDTTLYLTEIYGDWRTPTEDWWPAKSPSKTHQDSWPDTSDTNPPR